MMKKIIIAYLVTIIMILMSVTAHAESYFILPWYAVSEADINVCVKGVTTDLTRTNEGNVLSFENENSLYGDTISLVAIKTPTNNGYYYEIGWYVQPLNNNIVFNITVQTGRKTRLIDSGEATPTSAENGYQAYKIPCDEYLNNNCDFDSWGGLEKLIITYRTYAKETDALTGEERIVTIEKNKISTEFIESENQEENE